MQNRAPLIFVCFEHRSKLFFLHLFGLWWVCVSICFWLWVVLIFWCILFFWVNWNMKYWPKYDKREDREKETRLMTKRTQQLSKQNKATKIQTKSMKWTTHTLCVGWLPLMIHSFEFWMTKNNDNKFSCLFDEM